MNDKTPVRRPGPSISPRPHSAGHTQPDERVKEVCRCLQENENLNCVAGAVLLWRQGSRQEVVRRARAAAVPRYRHSGHHSPSLLPVQREVQGGCWRLSDQELLNDDLERRGDVTMFTMAEVHADNILAWLRHDREVCQLSTEKEMLQLAVTLALCAVLVKSVDPERSNDEIKKSINKAIKQLRENQRIFGEIVDNSLISRSVVKVVALPHIQHEQLLNLNVPQEDIVYLCKDHLLRFDTEVPEAELDVNSFRTWWQELPRGPVESQCLQEIVGKYVGLLSTPVSIKVGNKTHLVRHHKDSIREIEHRFQMKILTKEQEQALHKFKDKGRVYLKGPGGSGKTLLLITMAKDFLSSRDNHVIVVNMNRGAEGLCIGKYVFEQIKVQVKDHSRRIHQICIDTGHDDYKERFIEDVEKKLPNKTDMKKVLFIADEVHVPTFWLDILGTFQNVFKGASLWCAGFFSEKPETFEELCLEVVMRCPLAVQHLLYSVDWKEDRRSCYAAGVSWKTEVLLNGPLPLCIRHKDHQTGGTVIDCEQCARELAQVLKELTPDSVRIPAIAGASKSTRPVSAPVGKGQDLCQPFSTSVALLVNIPLKMYRDFDDSRQFKDISEPRYKKYLEKIGHCLFVQELRRNDIKVSLDAELGSKDLGTLVHKEDILTTWVYSFIALECGVVIFLPGDVHEPSLPPAAPAANLESQLGASSGIREVRDIPAPGVNPMVCCRSEVGEAVSCSDKNPRLEETSEICQRRGRVGGGDVREGGDRGVCLPELHWRRDDIERYSDWDKTNIVLAGSRCLSQLILLVP
ncbi:hypothetical protein C0Q70_17343 [Pomacea canaliculata]|uniref:Uncharacterized protein n=1 Tax=Pomacea canaliculata TaxID=400727 RepID=A0A2T7NK54_POMCA|nr:hypothetical protein C0Q70_17343 [Pomacea canaliculata]